MLCLLISTQGMMAGILRGSGRQAVAAVINFISYYVVGLPAGILLALVAHLGTLGMWSGLFIGEVMQVYIRMEKLPESLWCMAVVICIWDIL